MTTLSTIPTRPEADALREVFADEATIVANAIADLLAPRQPEVTSLGPIAKARAAIDAEESEYGPLSIHDRRRTRFVSAASGVPVDIICHVLHTREIERRTASRQG